MLMDGNEVHFRATKFGMFSTAKLTYKHLKLIYDVLILIFEEAVHLKVHLGLFDNVDQLIIIQKVYNRVH